MLVKLKLFIASLRRMSSRTRAKVARRMHSLAKAAASLMARTSGSAIAARLCQVAVGAALFAAMAGGVVLAAPGHVPTTDGPSQFASGPTKTAQLNVKTASDLDGDTVTVWQSPQDASGNGIYARLTRMDDSADPVARSIEFRVNTIQTGNQIRPDVAMDAEGNFVVVWTGPDSSSDGIWMQRFDANGARIGAETQINQFETNDQLDPNIAMDVDGDFVVTWSSAGGDGNSWGVTARMFSPDGTPKGNEFTVNQSFNAGNQSQGGVAMDAVGNFAVVWHDGAADGNGFAVRMRRFDATGNFLGSETTVNTTTAGHQQWPDIAMDVDGDFVVVWQSYVSGASSSVISGQLFDALGVTQGTNFQISGGGSDIYDQMPSVAMDADGNFIVAWDSYDAFSSSGSISYYLFSADGSGVTGTNIRYLSDNVGRPDVAMDADGDFVIAWHDYASGTLAYADVWAFRGTYDSGSSIAAPMVASVHNVGDHHQIAEGAVLLDRNITDLAVNLSEEVDETAAEASANWSLTRDGVSVPISNRRLQFNENTNRWQVILELSGPLADGDYVLTASENIEDLDANLLDGNRDGVAGGDFVRNFSVNTVRDQGGESRVNTVTAEDQDRSAIAMSPDGDYVIVWESDLDSTNYTDWDILAQRYSAGGVPVGSPITVNDAATTDQRNPAVAIDAQGNFVVVWESPDFDLDGVFAKGFDATGAVTIPQFRVNPFQTDAQNSPDVAMDAQGNFVVVWNGEYSFSDAIDAQRFDASGTSLGGSFVLNDSTGGTENPAVAMNADGDFVVAWEGYLSYVNDVGVAMRKFDRDGRAVGMGFFGTSEVPVGITGFTFFSAPTVDVAMDNDGDFAVVYDALHAAPSTYGFSGNIVVSRFDSTGAMLDGFLGGREVQSNVGVGVLPSISMDGDGDMVVTWTDYMVNISYYVIDATVQARRLSWSGEGAEDQFQVNTFTDGIQGFSTVAMDGDGNFVVTWISTTAPFSSSSSSQDGDGAGVYMQRYDENADPTTSGIADIVADENDAPVVVNLASSFADAEDADALLTYTIVSNTDPTVAVAGLDGSQLGVAFVPDAFGTTDITIRATDTNGRSVEDTFTVTVNQVVVPPVDNGGDDDDGCVAATTGAAPWGLLAVLFALFSSVRKVTRRKE